MQGGPCSVGSLPLALWVKCARSIVRPILGTGSRQQVCVKYFSSALFNILIKVTILVSGIQTGGNAEHGIILDLIEAFIYSL